MAMERYWDETYLPDDIRLSLEENPVHTLLYLMGTPMALMEALEMIHHLEKTGIEPKGQVYNIKPDEIRCSEDGENQWYDIVFDNHVPQIYDRLTAIEGMKEVLFVVYSSFDTFMNTNDVDGVMWKHREQYGIPEDLEVELDDDFPDTFDHASTNYK